MPKVKINEIEINYEIYGEGFPLVMIMGLGANLDWWGEELIEKLGTQFKVIIFDNRGAGRSDKPPMNYSIKLFADDTVGLMDQLNIKEAYILGISMGGMIAQELAINYPDRVKKLVLCSTSSGISFLSKLGIRILKPLMGLKLKTVEDLVEYSIRSVFTEEFMKNNPKYIDDVRKQFLKAPMPIEFFKRQLGAILKHNTRKRLKALDKPTLILHGKQDALISYKGALILADTIPYAKLALFEKTAHALFSHEPERVISTLIEFLR